MEDKQTILIVDDVELNRWILSETFREEYRILEAENGLQALHMMEMHREIEALLLDVIMPVMDGMEVLEQMKKRGLMGRIPVFLITAENSQEILKKGYDMGVADIIEKLITPFFIRNRIGNVIRLNHIVQEQEQVLRAQAKKIQELNSSIIEALSTAIEFRDCESGEHVVRMRNLTLMILREYMRRNPSCYLTEDDLQLIGDAAVMHDVGKIAIPDQILNKPGKLTTEEFEIMKTHTVRGCELLDNVPKLKENPVYPYAYDICRHHHERWGGKGYPDGLKGEEISIWAQVVSLADVYDALVSDRVYKKAYDHNTALSMIQNGECGEFNPRILDCLMGIGERIRAAYQK